MKNRPSRPPPFSRRAFLERSALVSAASAFAPWLPGCGDADDARAKTPAPLPFDPTKPWWLQNNYAPVMDELDVSDLIVRGSIPSELSGLYVRNGSNPQKSDSPHWFFGDGMVHGVRFEKGRALWYKNRFVRTELYENGVSFGEGSGNGPPSGAQNQGNVSVVWHGGKLLTSGEVGFPHELDPSDLSTKGVHDFAGVLKTSFTAHPKIDPNTGNMHFFGYWFLAPFLTYHVVAPSGAVIASHEIPVAKPSMVHSFAITDREVIFWECPVLFYLDAALAGEANPFKWTPDYGARIGVLPFGKDPSDMRWVEIPNCYVFHEVNAFRDGDDIVIDVCRHETMFDESELGDRPNDIRRWRIATGGDKLAFSEQIAVDRGLELPTHDRRFSGRATKHGWFVTTREHPDTLDFAGTSHVNLATGEVETWDPGPTRHADEAFFVAGGDGEGEGWLFTYVYDHAKDASTLAILDATQVKDGPLAEIELPRRVPHGFHAVWVPDA